jgi:hypothetical protein
MALLPVVMIAGRWGIANEKASDVEDLGLRRRSSEEPIRKREGGRAWVYPWNYVRQQLLYEQPRFSSGAALISTSVFFGSTDPILSSHRRSVASALAGPYRFHGLTSHGDEFCSRHADNNYLVNLCLKDLRPSVPIKPQMIPPPLEIPNRARIAQTADPHGRWRGIAHHQILYAG